MLQLPGQLAASPDDCSSVPSTYIPKFHKNPALVAPITFIQSSEAAVYENWKMLASYSTGVIALNRFLSVASSRGPVVPPSIASSELDKIGKYDLDKSIHAFR